MKSEPQRTEPQRTDADCKGYGPDPENPEDEEGISSSEKVAPQQEEKRSES